MRRAITVDGLNVLRAKLARVAEAPGLRAAVRQGAELLRDEATRALAQTGAASRLADSLEVREEASGDTTRFVVGTALAEGGRAEFGTRGRRATPFLLPALHAASPFIRQEIRNAVSFAAKSIALGRKSR